MKRTSVGDVSSTMMAKREGNLSDQAFELIERMIVLQQIEPGALVSEKQLMELTGFGRTPVREALQRLARERMVEIHPQRGVLLPPSSVETQLKLLELRRVLEPFAVRLAAERAAPAQRERAASLAGTATSGHVEVDGFPQFLRDAHELIVDAARNEYLSIAMAPLQGLSRRFWFANLTNAEAQVSEAAKLHAAILQAIAEGRVVDAEAGSMALSRYLTAFTYDTLPPRP